MTTVTICSSSKFYDTVKKLATELVDRGITTYTPRFDFDEEQREVTRDDKAMLTHEFLGKIRNSDAIYVVADGGYTGRSVCIEVGYATALGKAVFVSEQPAEAAIEALATAVVPIDELANALTQARKTLDIKGHLPVSPIEV